MQKAKQVIVKIQKTTKKSIVGKVDKKNLFTFANKEALVQSITPEDHKSSKGSDVGFIPENVTIVWP